MLLITGATNQIGNVLLPRLQALGRPYLALSRQKHEDPAFVCFNLNTDSFQRFENVPVDTLFHLASLELLVPHLKSIAQLGVQRIIAFSSSSVLVKRDSPNPHERSKIQAIFEAEKTIMEFCQNNNIALTIFRPTMIYGCNSDKTITFITKFIRRFNFFIVVGNGSGLRQPIHVNDLVEACLAAETNEKTYGKIYLLSGGEVLTYRELILRIFKMLGKEVHLLQCPKFIAKTLLSVLRIFPMFRHLNTAMLDRFQQDFVFDHTEATNDFNFKPRALILSE